MKKLFVLLVAIALASCMSCDSRPAFAGLTGYAYLRADYPSLYLNRVKISEDGKEYTNLGNFYSSYQEITSSIIDYTSTTMTLYYLGELATVEWTIDDAGLVIWAN